MDATSGEARSAVLVAARDVLRVAVALLQLAFGLVRHAFGLLLAVADEPGELLARLADHVLHVTLRLILVHRHLQSRTMVSAPAAACCVHDQPLGLVMLSVHAMQQLYQYLL